MQLAAGEVLSLANETRATRSLYGLDDPITAGYGLRCLMARRLVESGVRFVQVFPPVKPQSQPWDAHANVKTENEAICARTDLPSAALIKDLKARGLLESTLVIWSGEFGRLPVSQNGSGRDHNRNAFSLILAGGGFRAGFAYGETDDVGYKAARNRVSVPDLHATILRQLGLDHERLSYHHHGSEETLTDARDAGAGRDRLARSEGGLSEAAGHGLRVGPRMLLCRENSGERSAEQRHRLRFASHDPEAPRVVIAAETSHAPE